MADKNNSGALFSNDKTGNDKKPDYRGNLLANKEKVFISAWKRIASKTGNEFYSLSFNLPNSDFSIKDPDSENNKGALFNNSKKTKDGDPDLQGKAKILGVNYYIDAWEKEKDGRKYFTFLIKEIESKSAVPTGEHSQESQHNPEDESQEIPFDDDNQQSSDDSDDSAAFNIFTMGQG